MTPDPDDRNDLTTRRYARRTYADHLADNDAVTLDYEFVSRAATDELIALAIKHDTTLDLTESADHVGEMFEIVADDRPVDLIT